MAREGVLATARTKATTNNYNKKCLLTAGREQDCQRLCIFIVLFLVSRVVFNLQKIIYAKKRFIADNNK